MSAASIESLDPSLRVVVRAAKLRVRTRAHTYSSLPIVERVTFPRHDLLVQPQFSNMQISTNAYTKSIGYQFSIRTR